jgi:5-methylthioadenosine/S-adenosylhomocysteine deaminase
VWQMATVDGAHAMGLANVGVIRPGVSADIIAIDLDLPTPVTEGNLLDQLILWRDADNVDSVMCAGRWLKRNHHVLNADPEALLAKTREAALRLWAK